MSTPLALKGFKAFLRYALVAVIVVVAARAVVLGFLRSHEQLTLEAEARTVGQAADTNLGGERYPRYYA
jgi:hypothetical protein